MTNEEAKTYFEMRLADNHSEKATTQRKAFALAIEALEKCIKAEQGAYCWGCQCPKIGAKND